MTRFTRTCALVALLMLSATAALAAPGDCRLIRGAETPDDAADDVFACREDVWFHQAETKAGNAAGAGHGSYPSWDTTKPTASVQSGAGGGYLAAAVIGQNVSRTDGRAVPTFKGTYTGTLDNLGVTLYLFNPGRAASGDQAVWLQLKIDGQTVYQTGTAADRTPLAPAGDVVLRTDFAFTNLYNAMTAKGLDTAPGAIHDVELVVSQWFSVNDNAVYVYDTSEVPAGMVFNAETSLLKSYTAKFAAS